MNRHQRRQAARSGEKRSEASIPPDVFFPETTPNPATIEAAKPGLLLRLFAKPLLSQWVRRRVRHPAARSVLALIAREVGRHDLAADLEN